MGYKKLIIKKIKWSIQKNVGIMWSKFLKMTTLPLYEFFILYWNVYNSIYIILILFKTTAWWNINQPLISLKKQIPSEILHTLLASA